jgi:hypothetical protein
MNDADLKRRVARLEELRAPDSPFDVLDELLAAQPTERLIGLILRGGPSEGRVARRPEDVATYEEVRAALASVGITLPPD